MDDVSKLVETKRSLQIEVADDEKSHAFGQPKVAPMISHERGEAYGTGWLRVADAPPWVCPSPKYFLRSWPLMPTVALDSLARRRNVVAGELPGNGFRHDFSQLKGLFDDAVRVHFVAA